MVGKNKRKTLSNSAPTKLTEEEICYVVMHSAVGGGCDLYSEPD